jgi:hypothetical protein
MGRRGGGKEGERDQDRKAGKEERWKKRLCEGTWMLKAPPRRGSARGQVSMCIEDKKTDGVVWSRCIPLSWGSRYPGAFLLPAVHLWGLLSFVSFPDKPLFSGGGGQDLVPLKALAPCECTRAPPDQETVNALLHHTPGHGYCSAYSLCVWQVPP